MSFWSTLTPCESHSIPHPYGELLVHDRDLTPTLEAWYEGPLAVKVLALAPQAGWYQRLVVLTTGQGHPVSLGAIRLALSRMSLTVQEDVLAGRVPVGRILLRHQVPHLGCPRHFFTVPADLRLSQILACPEGKQLCGRCNVLRQSYGKVLAEVVEVLSPTRAALG